MISQGDINVIVFILSACSKVVDVVFVLDASGSIPEDDFQRILNFVRDLASRLDVESKNARVAVVTFSDNPEAVFYLNSYDQTAVGILSKGLYILTK